MISLYDILEIANGQLFGEPAAQIFTGFCLDPQKAGPGLLFVTLKNDYGDTYRYIDEVVAKGVAGILCGRPPENHAEGVSVILVRDTVEAMMIWARHQLAKTGAKVIGVAGSSGKSTVIDTLRLILSTRYTVHTSPPDTPDNRLAIPVTMSSMKPNTQFCIVRLGVTRPGEMAAMVEATQPEVGIITSIDHAYLESFETLEQTASEMALLVDALPSMGMAVLNYDDDAIREMGLQTRAHVMTVGVESFGAKMMAFNVVAGLSGTGFDLRSDGERFVGRWVPLLGKHQLYNVLTALAVGQHYDISLERGLRVLTNLSALPGRMSALNGINDSLIIDDTDGATPQSARMALDWLEAVRDERQRVVCVVGNMDHLGSYSQMGHRLVGQRAAEVADVLVVEGMEAAAAARAALDKGMDPRRVFTTYSTRDTVNMLLHRHPLTPDDLVFITGGVSMRMENVVRALLRDASDAARLTRPDLEDPTDYQPQRPSWIEIDTEALAANIRELKAFIGDNVTLMAVVKADAYGHGAVRVSQTALLNGAEYLAVASLQEALTLRDAGITAPILVLSYTPVYSVRQAIRQHISLTLYDLDLARAYERAAREVGGSLRVHVKIDTGMGRLGVMPPDVMPLFRHLAKMQHLEVEGLLTHFSTADSDGAYVAEQLASFRSILRALRAGGFNFRYIHAANSAATLSARETHFNMVRVGLAMYGLSPSENVPVPEGFQPVMTWKTMVAQVKTLPAGHPIGYGNTYITHTEERIAVIPVGYADGYRRVPTWGEVLIHGQRAPIIGRVSMEKTVVRVSHIPDVSIGDEVVLLGRQGSDAITAEEIAARLGTINYEVVCSVLPRVPRS